MTALALVRDTDPPPTGDEPGPIPAAVLAEVDAAWERATRLAAEGCRLHLAPDPATGRLRAAIEGPGGDVEEVPLGDLVGLSECRRAHCPA